MRPLLVQRVVLGVLRGTQAAMSQVSLQILHVPERSIEGGGRMAESVQRRRPQVIGFIFASTFSCHLGQGTIEHLLEYHPNMSARKPAATPALQSLAAPNGVLLCCIDEYCSDLELKFLKQSAPLSASSELNAHG